MNIDELLKNTPVKKRTETVSFKKRKPKKIVKEISKIEIVKPSKTIEDMGTYQEEAFKTVVATLRISRNISYMVLKDLDSLRKGEELEFNTKDFYHILNGAKYLFEFNKPAIQRIQNSMLDDRKKEATVSPLFVRNYISSEVRKLENA